jgi:hypothetical protein
VSPSSRIPSGPHHPPTERYVREWLPGQAAGGYICFDATTGQYSLTEAQALAFADPAGLVLPGAFQLAVACLADEPAILDAFRYGQGVAWGDHHPDVFTGCERFFRLGYVSNLVSSWLPAIPGLPQQLEAGLRGWSTVRIGGAILRAAGPIPRCVMTTIDVDTLAKGRDPIKSLAVHRRRDGRTWFAIHLMIDREGPIAVGDVLTIA